MLKHLEKTQKSTNVKSLTKIVRFQQFSELDRISHGADVVGQSVPDDRTRMLWNLAVFYATILINLLTFYG